MLILKTLKVLMTAVWLTVNAKNGISSYEIARDSALGISKIVPTLTVNCFLQGRGHRKAA
jgi:hypothetical protein